MIIGLLKEPGYETRISLLPDAVAHLTKKGIQVLVQQDAGLLSYATNQDYSGAGASITNREEVLSSSNIILVINTLEIDEIRLLKSKVLIGVYQPLTESFDLSLWAQQGITVFSLDMLPRTTRAQSMDVLSSQANIAGYKAVLLAASTYSRYLPMFMTAAGSIIPAKFLIIGAGVAGLQAIATAKRLGAVIEVFDTRPAVKEEVMSLGGKFIEVEGAADASKAGGYAVEQTEEFFLKQKEKIAATIAKSDIVITTAQIPGKKAPLLITTEMVHSMRNGSIIIDLAASTGGNSAFTKNNETIVEKGVTIIGNSNLQATMPSDASKLYGKNILNFLQLIISKENALNLNWDDDLVKGSCIVHKGEIVHDRLK
jgi:NAD(P) transhydrogenase subunit alpha